MPAWNDLVRRFDRPEVRALVLMGSYARGDANPYSDVDLVRFTAADTPPLPAAGSHLLDGRLVVVMDAGPSEVEAAFTRPEVAVGRIVGLRQGRALVDRDGYFAALQEGAHAFVWDAAMQARADAYASDELVGWAEEVRKGLAGLRGGDTSRLLDAEFGLSWGLNRLVGVQRGIPLKAGSAAGADWFTQVERMIGPGSEWVRLRRLAFGVDGDERPPTLRERVTAGLRLYVATAELLQDIVRSQVRPIVDDTVGLVRATLGDEHQGASGRGERGGSP